MRLPSSSSIREILRRGNSAMLLFDRFIEQHSSAMMFAVLLVYLGRAFFMSRLTDMTADELLTYSEAQLPTVATLWSTLKNIPTALDPPLHPFLSFLAFRLPILFPLNIRLPAIIGYAALILSLFVFLRRRAPASVALIASVLAMLIPVFQFAVQARPYALVLGCSGWALVFWQRAAEHSRKRGRALVGLYLSITCVLLCQYLGGLVLVPLVAGELWRSLRDRIDPAIWFVFAAAGLTIFTYIPLLSAASLYRAYPWHGVLTDDLWQTYLMGIAPVAIIVISLCSILWLMYQQADYSGPALKLREHEAVAIAVFYLVPVIAFGIAKAFTHSYVPRYSLVFSIAATSMLAIVIYSLTRGIRGLASATLLALLLYTGLPIIKGVWHPPAQNTGGINTSDASILDKFRDLPIAVPAYNPYVRFWLFGPSEMKRRMLLVSDPSAITEFGNNVGLATEAVQRALHAPGEAPKEFLQSHPHFLLLGAYWLRDKVRREGWQVVVLGQLSGWDLYYITQAPHP